MPQKAFHFVFLADRPEAVSTVSRWYFDEWASRVPGQTLAGTEEAVQRALNRDRIPLVVLAIENEEVVGAAELKFREMDIYPDRTHWLGGVFVAPEHRGKRIGSRLAERIAEIARSFEVETLYLQTERLDGGLYAHLGWHPCSYVHYKGLEVLVMQRQIRA